MSVVAGVLLLGFSGAACGASAGPSAARGDLGVDGGTPTDTDGRGPSIPPGNGQDGGPSLPAFCDPSQPFGALTAIPSLASGTNEGITLSADGLTAYLGFQLKLSTATRAARGKPFGAPSPLALANTGSEELQSPSLSPDGLTLFFIDSPVFLSPHKAVRASLTAAFSAHAHLELGVMGWSAAVNVRAAGSHLYFIAPPSQSNLALSVTSGENAAISSALALAAGERIGGFSISSDERTLYYQAHEGTSRRVYRSTRTDTSKPFDSGTSLAELSGTDAIVQNLHLGFVTDDECELFATSATDPSEPISRGFVHAVRGK